MLLVFHMMNLRRHFVYDDGHVIFQGLLRQVPIVSSVFNWLSPLSHERKVKGRTFDLSSGNVTSET